MKKIRVVLLNPLFTGIFFVTFGNNLINFLNYLYHLLMGRLLGPESYGELATLISLLGILSIVPFSFGLVIIKFISSSKEDEEVSGLITWFNKRVTFLSILVFALILLSTPLISDFLKLKNPWYIPLIGLSFLFSLPSFLNKSILQGLLKFKEMVITQLGENILKLALGIIFVYTGIEVFGAMSGVVVATFFGWIISRYFIKGYAKKIEYPVKIKPMMLYSLPIIINTIAITSMFSTDLILVKHFFTSHEAGLYASLSTLGRIIFFATAPISSVMFPMVSKKHSKGENYLGVFLLCLFLTFTLAAFVLLVYLLLPSLSINILYGSKFLEVSDLLIWFGVFMTLFTLSSLIITFCLSIGRTKVVYFSALAALGQAILIWFYHMDLLAVIMASIVVSALLLSVLFVYLIYETKLGLSYSSRLQTRKNHQK
jgi:O-antigen/teichoic acid export membrane protein